MGFKLMRMDVAHDRQRMNTVIEQSNEAMGGDN